MKKILLFLFLTNISDLANSQSWPWAIHVGGIGNESGGICLDLNNNIYSFGIFTFNCYFNTDTFQANGISDFFLAKYDNNGNEQWAKQFFANNFSGEIESYGGGEINPAGNFLFVSGTFYNTLFIDTLSVTSNGGSDIFLAKFDLNGNCVWLKKFGSVVDDKAYAIQFDQIGNLLITGTLNGTAQFSNFSVNAGTFFSKFDQNGNCLWALKRGNGCYFNCVKFLGTDIILTGTTTNDTSIVDTSVLISNNITDAILARFDSSGNVKWVKRNGGPFDDYGFSLGLDNSGSIYNSGSFKDSAIFNGVSVSNGSLYDLYLAKFDQNGNLIWIKQSHANGLSGAQSNSDYTDSVGNTYLIGSFGGTAMFGNFSVSTSNFIDAFLARYDSAGDCIGLDNFGWARGYWLRVEGSGSVIVTGDFMNSVNIGSTALNSYGQTDMYIAKHDAITNVGDPGRKANNQLIIYANPTTGKCTVTVPDDFTNEKNLVLSIYDNTGILVQKKSLEMNEGKIVLNLEAEAKGIYNIRLSNGTTSYDGKIVFE